MIYRRRDGTQLVMFTIGHSTRSIEVFVRLLNAHGVQCVIDVRTIPGSRYNPQFNRDRLSWARVRGTRVTYPTRRPRPSWCCESPIEDRRMTGGTLMMMTDALELVGIGALAFLIWT